MERLVPLDRAVLRPEIAVVAGEERILAHLEAPGTRALAHAASHLMRTSGQSTEDRAFEPASSGWVATGLSATGATASEVAVPEIHALLASARRKMSREIARLADAHAAVLRQVEVLSHRVRELEAQGARSGGPLPVTPPPAPRASPVDAKEAVPPGAGALRLPDVAALAGALEAALQRGITVRATAVDRVPSTEDLTSFHGSTLLDDDGEVLGLVLGDPRTVVLLGGAIMGFDEARLQEELVADVLSEEVVACASEVFASVATAIDGVPGNVHVRAGFLEPLAPGAHPWTASPASRLDVEDSRGARLVLLAR